MPISSQWSLPLKFPDKNSENISFLSHTCYLWYLSHHRWLDHHNGIYDEQGAPIPGTRMPVRLNFRWWHLIFVGLQHGTCSMSISGTKNFEVAPRFLKNMSVPDEDIHTPPLSSLPLQHPVLRHAQAILFSSHTISSLMIVTMNAASLRVKITSQSLHGGHLNITAPISMHTRNWFSFYKCYLTL